MYTVAYQQNTVKLVARRRHVPARHMVAASAALAQREAPYHCTGQAVPALGLIQTIGFLVAVG